MRAKQRIFGVRPCSICGKSCVVARGGFKSLRSLEYIFILLCRKHLIYFYELPKMYDHIKFDDALYTTDFKKARNIRNAIRALKNPHRKGENATINKR
jgi:hypothetical protein